MPSHAPNLRDTVAVLPVLVFVAILGAADFGVSSLASLGTPSASLAAAAGSSTELDGKCVSSYDYTCDFPQSNSKGGKCGRNMPVQTTQVKGHCTQESRAHDDQFKDLKGQWEAINNTPQAGTIASPQESTGASQSPQPTLQETAQANMQSQSLSSMGQYTLAPTPDLPQTSRAPSNIGEEPAAQINTLGETKAAQQYETNPSPFIEQTGLSGQQVGYMSVGTSPSGGGLNAFGDTQNVTTYTQPASFDSPSTFQQPDTSYLPLAPDWYQNQWLVNNNILDGNSITNPSTDSSFGGRTDYQNFGPSSFPNWLLYTEYEGASLLNGASFATGNPVEDDFNSVYQNSMPLDQIDQNTSLLQSQLDEIANGINMDRYYSSDGISPDIKASSGYQELLRISNFEPVQSPIGITGEYQVPDSFFNPTSQKLSDNLLGGGWADFRTSSNVEDRTGDTFTSDALTQMSETLGKNNPIQNPNYWNQFYNQVGLSAGNSVSGIWNSVSDWANSTWSSIRHIVTP